ncbi:hypothetical protein SLA2020_034510 [Shorea laevis]
MDALKENLEEVEIGSSVDSIQKLLESQRELFHSQIDQLRNVVVKQCQLTGVNPLAQEMAAGALSIKIGKRPRDLLNPKAIQYMQALFAIKDAISKKESREISALFGVTVTQVRDFFASQRTRVRKQVRLSREKAIRYNASKEPSVTVSDATTPVEPVPLNLVGPVSAEEAPSCSTQDDALPGLDESDRHFVENIFHVMRKEETFSGQGKLLEWILKIQNSTVLSWFLTKGGVMILVTWLIQAAIEEQTTILVIILRVLCHLPLHKALPEHMSAVLHSVNRLRFYRTSDISNRARMLLSRWSKIFARSQTMKKSNGLKSSAEAQNELLLKQSINEIMGDESWQSNVDNAEGVLVPSNVRKLDSPQTLKLLPAPTDDSTRKHILGASASYNRERRKVQLVEQPGQKTSGKSSQATRTAPVNQGRPMSADDIQKAKMRALYMQSKSGKALCLPNGTNEGKTETLNKSSSTPITISSPSSVNHALPKPDEPKKPVMLPTKTSNGVETLDQSQKVNSLEPPWENCKAFRRMESLDQNQKIDSQESPQEKCKTINRMETLDQNQKLDSQEPPWEKCRKVQILWQTPPEIKLNDLWRVGGGENSKEIDIQKNRNRREKETTYNTVQEIPSNPKEPWDREMDYDDTLTPEIPTEQPPDIDGTETQVVHEGHINGAAVAQAPPSSQIACTTAAEPDLELLAVLLKNPDLVFALTSGNSANLTSQETVKLLDMIKSGGAGLAANLNSFGNKVAEKVEVSLPSPTPPSNPGTSGWRPETVRNPFSQQSSMRSSRIAPTASTVEKLPASGSMLPHIPPTDITAAQQQGNSSTLAQQVVAAMTQMLPQSNVGLIPETQQPPVVPSAIMQKPVTDVTLTMKNQPNVPAYATSLHAAAGPSLRAETTSNIKPSLPVSVAPTAAEKSHTPFSVPAYLSRPQAQPQPSLASDPSFTHVCSSRPPSRNIDAVTDPWRARQGLASNPYSQAIQNNYNTSMGGPVQRQLRAGPPREGNEYVSNQGFESWSPDNSPTRSPGYVSGRNMEPGTNPGWGYRPDNSWQQSSSGYWDHNRQGNRRWRDRRR